MRKIDLTTGSLALGATVLLGALLMAPAAEADTQAARSRSSAGSSSAKSGSTASRSSAPSVSSSSRASASRGAAVTRSSGRRSTPGTATKVRGTARHRHSRGGVRFYGGYYGYPYYRYSHYPYFYGSHYPWGWSLGLGWWGGYFYSPYGYGYPYPAPHYYRYGGPPARAQAEVEPVGAIDLNVKPKKAEVWVDGRFVGTVGRFDGFPDYLWLDEGEHQLVFYLDGYTTVERQVRTLPGVVADLRLEMKRGPSTPPRQLAARPAPPPPPAAARPEAAAPSTGAEEAPPAAVPGGTLDLRQAPGRLVLSVEPEDASVYLDGRYLGTGRDLARLHAGLLIDSGEHRLEIVRPGYEGRAIDFSVAAGEEERIEVGLESG